MKVLLIDSGRGSRRGAVDIWRGKLGLTPDDTICLVSWQTPGEPLPVAEHLVFGPRLRRDPEPLRCQTASGLFDDADIDLAAMRRASAAAPQISQPGPAELPAEALAGQPQEQVEGSGSGESPEATAPAGSGETPPDPGVQDPARLTLVLDGEDFIGDEEFDEAVLARRAKNRTASLPVLHPARLRQAAKWRLNRVRLTGRRAYRRAKREIGTGTSTPKKAVRKVIGDTVANEYALAVARSSDVVELAKGVDVVVPMDYRSQRTAWVIAQRVPGPDVIVGFPAAARIIARRRAAQAGA